jgi:16S rRNA (adenine1518-N6/adenine1519-N6)-dimethyltransferase
VRDLLAAAGLRLRPARGQHFLVSQRILDRVLGAAALNPADRVLEVGGGVGTLTVALARTGAEVVSVAVAPRFVPVLRAVCAPYPRVRILHADAMAVTPATLPGTISKVVANLPYSIASPLLIRLLEAGIGRRHVVMVQAEVAARMVARPSTAAYGLLSVAIQAHAAPAIISRVSPAAFFPPPQVTSAIVRLDVPDPLPIPREIVPLVMALARSSFGQRRKMLRSSLQRALGGRGTAQSTEALCLAAGIDPRRRGESLSLAEFARLAEALADREPSRVSGTS